MVTKDILRIALFVLFVLFALRSGARTRVPGSVRVNSPAETEDSEIQQLLQRLKESREKLKQGSEEYENKPARKEARDFSSGNYFSAGAIIMIILLLMILT